MEGKGLKMLFMFKKPHMITQGLEPH